VARLPLKFAKTMAAFTTITVLFSLGACTDSCGKYGGAAQAIRSMTEVQKQALFREAEVTSCPHRGCELKTLQEIGFRWQRKPYFSRRNDSGSIVLAMCFDYGVDLRFEGLGTNHGQIILSYGEFKAQDYGKELIWSSQAKN
jgi:hypothetical protein